jgi:hypothetical protein
MMEKSHDDDETTRRVEYARWTHDGVMGAFPSRIDFALRTAVSVHVDVVVSVIRIEN